MAELRVDGIDQLLTELTRRGQQGLQIGNSALKSAGEIVKQSIEQHAPRQSGKLKNSIKVSGVKTKDGVKYVEIGPDKDAYYAKFLEFGTVKMRAKPFMAPALENARDQALAVLKEELRRGLGL